MWVTDHPVASAAILAGVLVLATLALAVVRGIGLWRAVKRSRREVLTPVAYLAAGADRAQDAVTRIERGAEEERATVEELQLRVAELQVIAGYAGDAFKVIWRPIRLLSATRSARR